jgi:hypothetical protein
MLLRIDSSLGDEMIDRKVHLFLPTTTLQLNFQHLPMAVLPLRLTTNAQDSLAVNMMRNMDTTARCPI